MQINTAHRGAIARGEESLDIEVNTGQRTVRGLATVYSLPVQPRKTRESFTYNTGDTGCEAYPAHTDVEIKPLRDEDAIHPGTTLLVNVSGITGLFTYSETDFGPELSYLPSGARVTASDDIELLGIVIDQNESPMEKLSSNEVPPMLSA